MRLPPDPTIYTVNIVKELFNRTGLNEEWPNCGLNYLMSWKEYCHHWRKTPRMMRRWMEKCKTD